eukprot:TRINITY_DN4166_c0_g1_i1.p1 TRINITY_DN4166_c0_g1~~TRINITY_DN4166_c0_g1_i1.p1  ORF type:complete len:152 (-),score=23.51 TRINITY_DN4166_c0_g1_i1:35-490(-)
MAKATQSSQPRPYSAIITGGTDESGFELSTTSPDWIAQRTVYVMTADWWWPEMIIDHQDNRKKIWLVFPAPASGETLNFKRSLPTLQDLSPFLPISSFRTHTRREVAKLVFYVPLPEKVEKIDKSGRKDLPNFTILVLTVKRQDEVKGSWC